jgi:spermidine/putrescine transport system ATP-binding protein
VTEIDVRLVGVVKSFGDVIAVDHVSLDIRRGEFFSLLGPSGCGKTTTLRMLGGFEQPDDGRIELRGRDVSRVPPYRRNVNTVFQSYALFPHLDVFENVAYGLRRKRVRGEEITRRVGEMLELVDLPGFERRRPVQLSGGQQQRVALARALVNHPEVLLLDEPLGALDLKLRKQMQLELKRIQHEVGITFIYVTHDQDEAMTMSDRIAVMRAGRIEQVGPPQEVYEVPATEFVAGFLGASNLLHGSVEGRAGREAIVVLGSGEKIRVPEDVVPEGAGRVRLGVRPEKIRILPGDVHPEEGRNAIPGRLLVSTYVGVSNLYSIRTRSGDEVTVFAQNLDAPGDRRPSAGDEVLLVWHPDHTFVLEETEGGVVGE